MVNEKNAHVHFAHAHAHGLHPVHSFLLFFSFFFKFFSFLVRDSNFFPPRLTRPSPFNPPLPASSRADFPYPAKVVGRGWGKILAPHHGVGRSEDGFKLFRPILPHPSPPCPTLQKIIIVNFSYSKTILFKQIYQYYLILFYPM